MPIKIIKGETWESQVESAFSSNVSALYDMFMALDMDKDELSHTMIDKETWLKLGSMVSDHAMFSKVKCMPHEVKLTKED